MTPADSSMEALGRSAQAARELLQASGIASNCLPINVERIAEALGFRVVRLFQVPEEFSGIVSPAHRLVGINGNHHQHRQRFTLAHEIGHVVLNHPPEGRCSLARISLLNREADTFASELLMPTETLLPLLARFKHPGPLSRLFGVSEEAMTLKIRQITHHWPGAVT